MSKNILVIDDDPMVRTLVKEMLATEGFTLEFAEDGPEGIERIEAAHEAGEGFRAVILDVVMPGMNGFDVLTRLKLHAHTQNIPVLMLTGEDRAEDIMTGYQTGADYYITKPFTRDQLLQGFSIVLGNEP